MDLPIIAISESALCGSTFQYFQTTQFSLGKSNLSNSEFSGLWIVACGTHNKNWKRKVVGVICLFFYKKWLCQYTYVCVYIIMYITGMLEICAFPPMGKPKCYSRYFHGSFVLYPIHFPHPQDANLFGSQQLACHEILRRYWLPLRRTRWFIDLKV